MKVSIKTIKIGTVLVKKLNPIRLFKNFLGILKDLFKDSDSESESKVFLEKKPIKLATLLLTRIFTNVAIEILWPEKPISLEKDEMKERFFYSDLDDYLGR